MHSIRNCRRRRELGEQLLQCRMKRQWTLAQTSALINGQLTPETIERIELGKHSMNNIHIIAPLCDVYEKDFVFQLIDLPPEQIAARKKAAAEKRLADKLAKKEKKALQKNKAVEKCDNTALLQGSEKACESVPVQVPLPVLIANGMAEGASYEELTSDRNCQADTMAALFNVNEVDVICQAVQNVC